MASRRDAGPAARLTPYELVFGEGAFEAESFPAIRAEAEAHGIPTADPDRFLLLAAAGTLLRELVPDDAPREAFREIGILLFQAYHFWRFDRRLFVLTEPLARSLATSTPHVGEWELTPPAPAGYLQLPRQLFWARVAEGEPAEPIDGFFWTMVGAEDPAMPPYARLDLLLVLGLRPGRPGFSVMDVSAPLGGGPGHWADLEARGEAADFANVLPGGDVAGLHALVTDAEALKLCSLCFWYVAAHPTALTDTVPPAAGDGAAAGPHELPPSALPFQRIDVVGERG
ncbi:MAG TPA: hypothetical protein VFQ38_14180 [Longimicrobiales bacterium]|nr:hypothetical protein [Longimicrobiales bacterium]